jgi:hypothetical protein
MRFATGLRLASVLALGLLLPSQGGCAAHYGIEAAAEHRAQTWECGKGGYGVALCPSPPRRAVPLYEAPARPLPKPEEYCSKAGYGAILCPSYGRPAAPRPAAPEAPARPLPKPEDYCKKAGYGAILCPSYGR